MQGDDVSKNPSACQDILSGLGTPFEVLHARGLPRKNRINQLSSMLVGSSIIANAVMEDYKVLGHKEEENVRLQAEGEALVKAARQELTNLKAANAALVKEKTLAEVAVKESREAEARSAKELEEAVADRNNLNKVVEDLKNRTEAEARARETAEARDSLTISLDQLKADCDWMRDHGIGHVGIRCPFIFLGLPSLTLSLVFLQIVGTIFDAPENASAINELKKRAWEEGFKVGYKECLSHVNPFYKSKFTDERSGFHGIDTEARYVAAAEDYVDRLRLLYDDPEEEETADGSKGDVGTGGTKEY
ncbi:hypothetical protein Hanom_Chr04g00308811 [Helianthus anomalus]